MIAYAGESPHGLHHISASSAKLYLSCPLRYCFEKVLKLPSDTSAALLLGKAVHAGLSAFNLEIWKHGSAEVSGVLDHFDQAFAETETQDGTSWPKPNERDEILSMGKAMLEVYIEDEKLRNSPRPVAVEAAIQDADLGFDYPVVGILDLVRQGGQIVDYKTTSRCPSDPAVEAWNHELQLVCYELLYEYATEEKAQSLELVYLVKTNRPKVVRHQMPPSSETAKQRFRKMIDAFVDGVENERFYPCPGMQCAWCPFRQQCAEWKGKYEHAKSMD